MVKLEVAGLRGPDLPGQVIRTGWPMWIGTKAPGDNIRAYAAGRVSSPEVARPEGLRIKDMKALQKAERDQARGRKRLGLRGCDWC